MKVGKFEIHRPAAMSLQAQATWARLVLRFTMWTIIAVSVLLLVIGVAGFFIVQTDWFHRWSAQKVEEVLANELEARVEFSALRVNIFKGIELDSVRLITRGDTVLSALSLTAHYEVEPLLLKSIVISGITLRQPIIRLLRSTQDSTWNVEHIVKPKQDTTPPSPFSWGITLRDLTISDGKISVYDSLSTAPLPQRIHYTRTTLNNVHLTCSAILNIASKTYTAGINNFTFCEERTGFSPREFRLAARVDTTALSILNLHLITDSTDIELDARFDSVNVFDGGKIERAPFRCSLSTPRLLANELNLFLPPTFSLKGMFAVDADVDGSINTMNIAARQVQTRSTDLRGTVVLDHLADGKPFTYTIDLEQSKATYNEVRDALPTVVLPEIPFLRQIALRKAHCFGIGDSLFCDVDAESNFGALRGTARLGMRPLLEYDADVMLENFDVSAITLNGATASRLNGRVHVVGKGTTLSDAASSASLQLDASSFAGRQFRTLVSNIQIAHRVVNLDTMRLEFPDVVMDSTDVVFDGEPRWLEAKGNVDFNTVEMPIYSLALILQHTPLASLVRTPTAPRLLSGSFNVQGVGFHPDSISANLAASVDEFLLADRAIFPFSLKASVLRRDKDNRTVTLVSEPADISLDGRFRLTTFGPVFLAQIEMIDKFIRKKASAMSSDTATIPTVFPYRLPEDTLDMRYTVQVRNLAPAAPFLQGVKINTRAEVRGVLRGSQACYELQVDTAYIPKFSMQLGSTFMTSQPLRAHILLRTENMNTQPDVVQADVDISCDSVFRVEQTRYVRPSLSLRLVEGKTQFSASTRINNRMPVAVRGSLTLNDNEYLVALDSLRFGLNRSFAFSAQRQVRATITPRGTMIHDLLMKHDSSRAIVSAQGVVNSNRFDGMSIGVQNFSLRTLQRIPEVAGIEALELLDGWVDSLKFLVRGAFTKPQFTLDGAMRDMRYNNVAIGTQHIALRYDGRILDGVTFITNAKRTLTTADTALSGTVTTLPISISLLPFDLRLRDNERVQLSLVARHLSMAAAAPFIPGVSNVQGLADATLEISGTTPDKMNYVGSVRYDSASFLIPATNIRYTSKGAISLKNTVVNFDSVDIYNEATDLRGGHARATGIMRLRGFNVDYVDIEARINDREKLLVMSNASAVPRPDMFGRTILSTVDDGTLKSIRFHGALTDPRLDGFVMLEEADIKFPPSNNNVVRTSTFVYTKTGSNYAVTQERIVIPTVDTNFDVGMNDDMMWVNRGRQLSRSLDEILFTSVDVKIKKELRVQMDFSAYEQLVAFVRQENPKDYLQFIRDGNRSTKLLGSMMVGNNSTYKFYNLFTAQGNLRFVTGQIDNPELNLTAYYDGTRIAGDRQERFQVRMNISGTKKLPRVRMTYSINGEEAPGMRGDQEKINTNAILLTLVGRTQEELTGGSSSGGIVSGGGVVDQIGNSAKSSALSAFLTNVLQGGVIKNVNIDFGGSGSTDFSQARFQLTGQLFGANITLGGSVADFTTNSTITFDLPLADILNSESFRSFIVQFMRSANPGQNTVTRQQKEWEIRIGGRFP